MSTELLEEYIQSGNTEELVRLLNNTPGLAKSNTSYAVSPLMLSCYLKKPEISKILANYAGDLDIFEAAALGEFEVLAALIEARPELINAFSEDGFTPLGLACHFGHEEITRHLLFKGAEPNLASANGYHVYPLHAAVTANNLAIAKLLIEAGAHVNIVQRSGITPLHSAAQHGNIEMLILLLEAGANVSVQTEDGRTPSEIAGEKGFKDIARILAE